MLKYYPIVWPRKHDPHVSAYEMVYRTLPQGKWTLFYEGKGSAIIPQFTVTHPDFYENK